MYKYLDLMDEVLTFGVNRPDRTGIGTKALFFKKLSFDLQEGFPLITTKEMNFKSIKAELIGFLNSVESAREFRRIGTKIWDANANAEYWQKSLFCKGKDDLGRIYGTQWRNWNNEIDQLSNVIRSIKLDPYSRRHCVTAWNPSELHKMCLPPCHLFFQFFVENEELSISVIMRSVDIFLGMPFDIASYALLLSLVAKETNLKPRMLNMLFNDTHIYLNHIEQCELQLNRKPYKLPELELKCTGIDDFLFEHEVHIKNYNSHDKIIAPMAL